MTTIIEDDELIFELGELYLLSKQEISDLDFIERELDFLKKLFGRAFPSLIKNDDFEKIADILIKAAHIDKDQAELKDALLAYRHQLEHLMDKSSHHFELSLIETHAKLEQKLHKIFLDFKSVKKDVFDVAKSA